MQNKLIIIISYGMPEQFWMFMIDELARKSKRKQAKEKILLL